MSCNLFYGIICAKKYINLSVVRVVKCCGHCGLVWTFSTILILTYNYKSVLWTVVDSGMWFFAQIK